jgi:histidinol-phosphate aminotransferase
MYNVKDSIKNFVSYRPNTVSYRVKLDANESIENQTILTSNLDLQGLHLYPDHFAISLRQAIAAYQNVDSNEILVGNGSSELLELVVKTFVNPGDKVLSVQPSFVMYEKYTQLSNGIYQTIPVRPDMSVDIDRLIQVANQEKPKIIFLCTPNNPTGYLIPKKEVIRLVQKVNSIIVVDEAYMEFAQENQSVIDMINQYQNLIVARTFSKAFGLAAIRLGYIIANKALINVLNTPKTPYSVNTLSQRVGQLALSNLTYLKKNIERVNQNRSILNSKLIQYGIKTFPSQANFIYCYFDQFSLAKALQNKGVLIRSFPNNFYRITIGNKQENEILYQALEEIFHDENKS